MKYTTTENISLIDFLSTIYRGASRQKLKSILKYNRFWLGDKEIRNPNTLLPGGKSLEIKPHETSTEIRFQSRPYLKPVKIFFEDENLIVVQKPAGILSGGEETSKSPTFFTLLKEYLESKNQSTTLQLIHRLDREVGGLIIFTRKMEIAKSLKKKWKEVEKTYLALVEGNPPEKEGKIENWLKDGPVYKVMAFNKFVTDSKLAITHYKTVKQIGQYTLLEIRLETGRKNQIRVHMAGLGCPIVGDWKYGADKSVSRQIRLFAAELKFLHPVTGKLIHIKTNPPKNFLYPSHEADEKYK